MRLVLLNIILILMFSCQINKSEVNDNSIEAEAIRYRFYDFNFKVDVNHRVLGIKKRIVYSCDSKEKSENIFKVSYLSYYDENSIKLVKPLETDFYVGKEEMDTIFNFLIERIEPKFSMNKALNKIPLPPISANEWEYSTIELDLIFRGDKYLLTSNKTSFFNDLLELLGGNGTD